MTPFIGRPPHEPGKHWLTVSETAKAFNKHPRTVNLWCTRGHAVGFGFRIFKDAVGQWFILVPDHVVPDEILATLETVDSIA